MIIKDNLPMYFVENIGFKQFLHKVLPLYSLPSRRTFTRMLDARYDVQSTIFREKLQSVKFYTVTADIWTEAHQTRSFLGITLHYLEDTNMMTKNLSVHALDNRHTSEYISSIFNPEWESWGINRNKILAVVTDNGQNMVKAACDTFGVDNHVHCFANTLNLMAETAIKNEPVISELIERIKRIVTWFKQSCIASDALRRKQVKNGVAEASVLKLIQSVDTRWNSKFFMIDRFLLLRQHEYDVLLNAPKAPNVLNANEINMLKELKKY
jgi:hypothetical protein